MLKLKYNTFLILISIFFLLSSCANENIENKAYEESDIDLKHVAYGIETVLSSGETAIIPSYREGVYTEKISETIIIYDYDFIFKNFDAAAVIRIGNWIREVGRDEAPSDWDFATEFEAEVIEVFSGELPDKISYFQYASAKVTPEYHPCHTFGNEVFVLLDKDEDSGAYYPHRYYFSEFDYIIAADGEAYVADIEGEPYYKALFDCEINDYSLIESELLERKIESDGYWNNENIPMFKRIINAEDLKEIFRENTD